jgi:NadR type nicotinamide-nucleotide adenylyltransferase
MARTRGLVLGKFMPPHKGHIHLIETAARQVDELTVMVCSIKKEPISGALRYAWMKALFPKLRVIHVTDENPQFPKEHRFFWQIWVDTIQRNCPNGLDYFFSSELYGDELAIRLNIQHVLVDLERKTVPISASQIRNNPYLNWEFIPRNVRPYYLKRVVLTGPESVGKSVLSKKLANHFKTIYVEEYGRDYCEKMGMDLTPLDFAHIAGGHILKEDEAALNANQVLICDTDLIVTQIWAEIMLSECPVWITEMSHHRKYDLYLLLKPDIPWVDDGTRAFEEVRPSQFERLKEELESRNLNYVVIEGNDFEKRFEKAVAEIQKILN